MKDSGIEWIGEIPEGWEVSRIGSIYLQRNTKVSDKEYEPLSVTKSGIVPQLESAAKTIHGDDRKLVLKGDFVINSRSDRKGSCGISYLNGSVSLINIVIMPFRNIENRYYNYCFKSHTFAEEFYKYGYGIVDDLWSTKWQQMKKMLIPFPKLSEQIIIADFLDNKCSKLDSIIEKTRQQIEKLKTYKQSVIAESVTKGLDPNVKMKDSGVEWIGEVPKRWEVRKLKYLGTLASSGVDKKTEEGEKLFKAVHYMDVYRNSLKEIGNDDYLVVSANENQAEKCTLNKGDVLFTNSSETPEDMGHSTIILETLENTLYGYHLMRFRPSIEFSLYYQKYLFGSHYLRKWFEYRSKGMTRFGISYSDFAEAKIIFPPVSEQTVIANYLDKKCSQIDTTIAKKEKLIEKLNQYKKSLIFEAVTGKLEV